MRLTSLFAIPFIFAAATFPQANHAQSGKRPGASATAQGCPISFRVQRQAGLVARFATDATQNPNAQGLELTFTAPKHLQIAGAGVLIIGDTSQGRVLRTDPVPRVVSETYDLTLNSGERGIATVDLWTRNIVSVHWAEVTEIRYVDGSVWRESSSSQCRAHPPLLLLTGL